MSGQTYYTSTSSTTQHREQRTGFDTREESFGGLESDKQGYEENLSKFKGWSWDLWTYFINVVDGMATATSL
jgi:hypothetical protein